MQNTDRLCLGCMSDNGGDSLCALCGWDSNTPNPDTCLPTKFRLNDRYLVGRVLAQTAEQITYIGWDGINETPVHLREYFPQGLCTRYPDGTVSVQTDNKFDYNDGLLQFLNLNRTLAKLSLPSLIGSVENFEENGTAYAVLPVIQSISLAQFLERNGDRLKWEQARPLLLPLLDTLAQLHENGIIHGALSPESILVGRDGKLRLCDFSIAAVRQAGGAFGTDLASGFAAAEQSSAESILTPAADVYGLSAVLFRVLIGQNPPDALSRAQKDSLTIPAHFAEELPRPVLVALANGLQIAVQKRTPDIETFRNEMVYGETAEQKQMQTAKKDGEEKPKAAKKKKSGVQYALISALVTALVFLIIGGVLFFALRDQLFGNNDLDLNTESDFTVVGPSENLGDVDSDALNSVKQYSMPDFRGKYYSQVEDNDEYRFFDISLANKVYSDQYARGQICEQSVEPGKSVEKDTAVQLTVSLGKREFALEDVCDMTEEEAKIALLKQGFLYENIKVEECYDKNKKPGIISDQFPLAGTTVNAESVIKIFINTYEGEEEEETVSQSGNSKNR